MVAPTAATFAPTQLRRPRRHNQQVVDLVAQGLTNPQIGERLFISPRTVQGHLARIFPKVDVSSRSELAALAATRAQK